MNFRFLSNIITTVGKTGSRVWERKIFFYLADAHDFDLVGIWSWIMSFRISLEKWRGTRLPQIEEEFKSPEVLPSHLVLKISIRLADVQQTRSRCIGNQRYNLMLVVKDNESETTFESG